MSRQPRFSINEWVWFKQTDSLCRVQHHAQSPAQKHMYTVAAPATATYFAGSQNEFRKLTRREYVVLRYSLRRSKEERWNRILAEVRKANEAERKRKELDNHDLVVPAKESDNG